MAQLLAVHFDGQETGDDVIGGLVLAQLYESSEVVIDLLAGSVHHRQTLVEVKAGIGVQLLGMQDAVSQTEEHRQLVFG